MKRNKTFTRSGIMLLEYDKYPDSRVIEMFHIRDAIRMAYIKDTSSGAVALDSFECGIWRNRFMVVDLDRTELVMRGGNAEYFDYFVDFLVNNTIDKISARKRWEETNDSLIVYPAYRAVVLFREDVFLVTDLPLRLATRKLVIDMNEDKKLTGAKFAWRIKN